MIDTLRTRSAWGGEHPDDGVTGFVIGGAAAVLSGHEQPAFGAEHDPVKGIGEVSHLHALVVTAGGGQRRLVG